MIVKLGTDTFEIPDPYGMESFALQQRLLPIVGRLVGVFFGLLGEAPDSDPGKLLDVDVMRLIPLAMPGIGNIVGDMPPGELEYLTRALLGSTTCNKLSLFQGAGGGVFDTVMRGRNVDTWKLIWAAIQTWYPDFFVLGRGFRGTAQTASTSTASTTSSASPPATDSSTVASAPSTASTG